MAVTAQMVKELREMTGSGMMDCKKALVEADGDMDKAVEILKEKGLAKAEKKAGRIAAMGLVKTAFAEDGKTAAIVEVNSETDFVAKNAEFIGFVEKLAALALDAESNDIEAFKAMPFDDEATIGDALTALVAKIGEKLSLRRIDKVSGEVLSSYIHGGGTIGVIVAADGADNDDNKTALKNIAMQVAAMNPQYVSRDEISADELENLRKITLESALNDPFSLTRQQTAYGTRKIQRSSLKREQTRDSTSTICQTSFQKKQEQSSQALLSQLRWRSLTTRSSMVS